MRAGRLDSLEPGAGLGDDFDVPLMTEDHGEPAPHQGLIVDDSDPNAHAGSSPTGKWATT